MATRAIARPSPVGTITEPTIKEERGLWSWITTVDHKRIGIMYMALAIIFFLIGGIEAMLIRVQLAQPNQDFVSADTYNQLFTMHGTTMIFLAVMPLSGAFFNYLTPLMIGARDVAFPRLNAFSWWMLLFGAILLNVGWLIGESPNQGWYGYANLTSSAYSPGRNVDIWLLGLQVLGISSLASAVNFFITIVNMRAPGMKMMRMPVFAWMTLIVAILIILSFPALTIGLTLLMFDRFFDTTFFVPEAGGSPLLWQHLFWVFGHPEVYILILPAFGIVSDILPTFSRKPLFGYSAVVFAGAAIAFLGFGVWAHHMFTVGMGPVPNSVFAVTTMLIALPTGVKIFNWIFTMWGGAISFRTPMLFSIGMIGNFVIGGLSGVMHASPPVDSQQNDSYFVVAHFHYVLMGGAVFGLLAGFFFWFPKITGKMYNEFLGKLQFWLVFIGFNAVFLPMHWLGMEGMPRRYYTYGEETGWGFWNLFETLSLFVLALGFVVFIVNILMSLTLGEKAPADPWDGFSLEWTIPSPPPVYNFARIPEVTSRVPFWTEKYPEVYGGDEHGHGIRVGEGPEHEREHTISGVTAESHRNFAADDAHASSEEQEDAIHLPNPSLWPLITAFGVAMTFGGMLISFFVVAAAIVLTFVGIYGWALQPAFGHGDVSHGSDTPTSAGSVGHAAH